MLTWRMWWAPSNASKGQMRFNSAFKGLMYRRIHFNIYSLNRMSWGSWVTIVTTLHNRKFCRSSFSDPIRGPLTPPPLPNTAVVTGDPSSKGNLQQHVTDYSPSSTHVKNTWINMFMSHMSLWHSSYLKTVPNLRKIFLYFLVRATQYIYLNINQHGALNFMSLFQASTCFELICSSSGEQNCTIESLVSSHL